MSRKVYGYLALFNHMLGVIGSGLLMYGHMIEHGIGILGLFIMIGTLIYSPIFASDTLD